MIYKFHAYGHPNILGAHNTTLEFTKDKEVTLKGDCIIGIKADFDLGRIKEFIKNIGSNIVTITIKTPKPEIQETILAELNIDFDDNNELVIRKTDFASKRTFAIKSNKAAFELDRDLIEFLKKKENEIAIIVENKS